MAPKSNRQTIARRGRPMRSSTPLRGFVVSVLAMCATGQLVTGQGLSHGENRPATGTKRFSVGFLAGGSLTPPQQELRFFFGQGVSNIPGDVLGPLSVLRRRYGSLAPIVGAFCTTRLTERVSLQGGVSWRRMFGTELVDLIPDEYDDPIPETQEVSYSDSPDEYAWRDAAWEIPVTVNYRIGTSGWRPFVGAGPTFRLPGKVDRRRRGQPGVGAGPTFRLPGKSYDGAVGVSASFGFDLPAGRRWTVTPQVRFTRWFFAGYDSLLPGYQFQAVIAFAF